MNKNRAKSVVFWVIIAFIFAVALFGCDANFAYDDDVRYDVHSGIKYIVGDTALYVINDSGKVTAIIPKRINGANK